MKTSKAPYATGNYRVRGEYRTGPMWVCAPPGWHRLKDGTYEFDGAAGPEHSHNRDHAYPFTALNAARVAGNCCGTVEAN